MKRLCCFVLCLAACCLFLIPGVSAEEMSGTCGDGLTWTFLDGTLTISGTGDMADYLSVNQQPWAQFRDKIQILNVESGVTSIGDRAFQRCTGLVQISLPEGLEHIGAWAFWNCLNLSQIPLPGTVTEIGAQAFAFNYALKELTIPEGVVQISTGIVQQCSALESVVLPYSATSLEANAFNGCTSLTSVTLPWRLKSIGENCFYGSGLTSVILPDTLTELGSGAFQKCEGLTFADTGDGLTQVPKEAFYACEALRDVRVGDRVTNIGMNAFRGCSQLESISFGKSIARIDAEAFESCGSITKVEIADVAGWCKLMLNSLYSSPLNYGKADLYMDGKAVTELVIPGTVTTINRDVFFGCNSLRTVTVSEGVEVIGAGAFQNCKNLEQLNLPATLYSIGNYAFVRCQKLQAVTIPAKVVALPSSCFGGCESLKTVTFLGSYPVIAEDAFYALGGGEVVADCYYPANDHSWTEAVLLDYGGELTWHPAEEKTEEPEKTASVTRVFGENRYATALLAADVLKEALGVSLFDTVVVASGSNFADALSGSYLAAVKNAPMLLVRDNTADLNKVKSYIEKNLKAGGTVYLLGGVNAVPKAMESGLEGFAVKRLGGATRYDTNLIILKEAGVGDKDILVCTGKGFADSLSASAAKLPILLVKDGLSAEQTEFLRGTSGKKYIIGGEAAVNAKIETALKSYGAVKRLGGNTRYETSVLVAKAFFNEPAAMVVAYAGNFPDGLSGGALAAAMDAPLILSSNGKEAPAVAYAAERSICSGYVLGGSTLISDKTVKSLYRLAQDGVIEIRDTLAESTYRSQIGN